MPRNQCCHRGGGPGRPMKPRNINSVTDFDIFVPMEGEARVPITIGHDEVEALRLVDYLGQSQEEAATSMGVSRGTVWRCVDSGRRKMAAMLVEGRPLLIRPDGQDTGEMIRFP